MTPNHTPGPIHRVPDRYNSAARMLGFALAADSPGTWQSFGSVMAAKLTAKERGAIALILCETLPDCALSPLIDRVKRGAGMPPVPLDDVHGPASLWAVSASEPELNAYLVAAFKAIGKDGQREFADYAARQVKA